MGYITVAEAKTWLGITDQSEDEQILALIEAASAAVSAVGNRDFDKQTVTEYYYGMASSYLFLRRTPVISVDSVEINGTAVEFTSDSLTVKRTNGTFQTSDYVKVTYTGGFEPIPADVKLATKMTVQAMRNAAAMDPNLTGESLGGVFSGGYSEFGPGAVPRAARNLLNNYIKNFTL